MANSLHILRTSLSHSAVQSYDLPLICLSTLSRHRTVFHFGLFSICYTYLLSLAVPSPCNDLKFVLTTSGTSKLNFAQLMVGKYPNVRPTFETIGCVPRHVSLFFNFPKDFYTSHLYVLYSVSLFFSSVKMEWIIKMFVSALLCCEIN